MKAEEKGTYKEKVEAMQKKFNVRSACLYSHTNTYTLYLLTCYPNTHCISSDCLHTMHAYFAEHSK